MKHQILLILIGVYLISVPSMPILGGVPAGTISEGNIALDYRNVTVYAPAVSELGTGYPVLCVER